MFLAVSRSKELEQYMQRLAPSRKGVSHEVPARIVQLVFPLTSSAHSS
jgi:hypothetical protein